MTNLIRKYFYYFITIIIIVFDGCVRMVYAPFYGIDGQYLMYEIDTLGTFSKIQLMLFASSASFELCYGNDRSAFSSASATPKRTKRKPS